MGGMSSIRPWRNIERRKSRQIMVGRVPVGGDAPITVQTMTNTPTSDAVVITHILDENGEFMEGKSLEAFAERHDLRLVRVTELEAIGGDTLRAFGY